MTQNFPISPPSFNPAESLSDEGLYDFFENKIKFGIEKVAPAQIISYNRSTNRAVVQILASEITSTGQKLPRQPLKDIPVFIFNGGGFSFSFPVQAQDIGWIIAADRDISIFKKLLQTFAPATYEKHRYEDGFFLPANINGFNISSGDENSVILTSLDGSTKLTVQEGLITMTAANSTFNGNVAINGNLTVTGTITATETITSNSDVISGTISGKTHTHTGVTTGTGITGTPQ